MSDDHVLVSAIMLVHEPDLTKLRMTIDCFQEQSYPYKELIIINNAKSQQDAAEVKIEAKRDVFLIDTPQFLPAGQARNYGISVANGQIIAQFDYDCYHHPNRIERQVSALAETGAAVCVLSRALSFSFNSGAARYWENQAQMVMNSMVYMRPANIDYDPMAKGEELSIYKKMTLAGGVAVIQEEELLCKLHYSSEPLNSIINSSIKDVHMELVAKIIESHNIEQ
jgi:glycosyltransferase involved in cell wall biosynthesis